MNLVSVLNMPSQMERAAVGILGLDVSRLHIYQSYQMSYFSLGSTGFTQGVYLNTMTYDFSFPMSVALQWGISHQPFGSSPSPYVKNGLFLSRAQVRYQPTKNILLQMDYVQNPYRYHQNPNYYPGYLGW
ncbi:hypothetical protein JXO59_13550 [candidate division KSB1 bacterium]|nr:hypothetical protein [candidate division KSB1 bacterium]